MFRRILALCCLSMIGSQLFFLEPAHAIDTRCFTQSKCIEERKKTGLTDTEAPEGFYQSSETAAACGGLATPAEESGKQGEPLGFCLPAGQTITAISFGGRTRFAHIGEFIQFIYQYGFIIGTIIATLMIIVGGFQWTVSAGSPAAIQSAQKRIVGAIIGLILMALSYTILNTINPQTVNLRLPQIWMVNPAELAPTYCDQTEKKTAFYQEQNEIISTAKKEERVKAAVYQTQEAFPTQCKSSYLIEGSGSLTCRGVTCPVVGGKEQVCAPSLKNISLDDCYPGDIVLTYQNTALSLFPDFATEVWDTPPIDGGETELHGLCTNGRTFEVDTTVIYRWKANAHVEMIAIKDRSSLRAKVTNNCRSEASFKGFFLIVEMNENNDTTDEDHYIGKQGKDLGDGPAFVKTKFSREITQHLWTLTDLIERRAGGNLVQVNNIYDIDDWNPISGLAGDELRRKVYADIGFQ